MSVPPQAIQAILGALQGGGGQAAAGQGGLGATPGFGGGLPGLGGGGQEQDERTKIFENFKPITGEFTPLDPDELAEVQSFLSPQQAQQQAQAPQSVGGLVGQGLRSGFNALGNTQQGLGGAGF